MTSHRSFLWGALALAGCGTTANTATCDSLGVDVPSPRGEVSAAYDAARQRLIVFAGNEAVPVNCALGSTEMVADTWAWREDCGAFQKIEGDGPKARSRYAVGLDAASDRMIVHGGRFRRGDSGTYRVFNDTWALDLTTDTWSEVATTGSPGARSNHGGAMVGGRFVIFGGNASDDGLAFDLLDDVWALDPATSTWEKVRAPGGPDARLYHAVAGDDTYLYVYGGGGTDAFFGAFYGDLWRLDVAAGTWTMLHDGETGRHPEARIWGSLAVDGERDRLLAFAGHDGTDLGNTNDVWAFDLTAKSWSKVRGGDVYNMPANDVCDFPADFTVIDAESPERREAGAGAFTPDGRLLIFGGKTDCGNINDVWSFDAATDAWSEQFRATAGEVCLRTSASCSSMCF